MTAPGGVADEAAKFLSAAEIWLRRAATVATPTKATGAADDAASRVVRELFAPSDAHRSDGPCSVCPLCQLISAARSARPDVVDHLAQAASSVVLAFRALTEPAEPAGDAGEADLNRRGAEGQPDSQDDQPVVQHITVN